VNFALPHDLRVRRRRRRVVRLRRRTQNFCEDRLQTVCPDLVALGGGMQIVNRHPRQQIPLRVRQLVVDVEIPDLLAIGEFGEVVVDPIDHRHPILGELSFCQAISAKYFDDGHRQGRGLIRHLR